MYREGKLGRSHLQRCPVMSTTIRTFPQSRLLEIFLSLLGGEGGHGEEVRRSPAEPPLRRLRAALGAPGEGLCKPGA